MGGIMTTSTQRLFCESSRETATKMLAALSNYFRPREPMSDMASEMAVTALSDLTVEQLDIAGSRAVRELKFMPTVAELRALAGLRAPTTQEHEDGESLAAWNMARDWVRKYSWRLHRTAEGIRGIGWRDNAAGRTAEKLVDLPERIRRAVDTAGGPDAIYRHLDLDGLVWIEKRFREAYGLLPEMDSATLRLAAGDDTSVIMLRMSQEGSL